MKASKSDLKLFDVEEQSTILTGPVVCLGMEFENDEARRAYFREELRKKLPELRKIEGFPVGEDDDILALSDPPYYTACPNPWLNDFIAEWEQEKKELVKQGVRDEERNVTEPYASDVSEGKNNPIYMAHSYHTKVPHQAIMRYILRYTQPGDVVLDGFCGTGMTGVAANLCGSSNEVKALGEHNVTVGVRHGLCSDLSPIASMISASYNQKFDPINFKKKAEQILDKVETELGWMYDTKVEGKKAKINYAIWSDIFTCPGCGKEIVLWDSVVSEDTKTMVDSFNCPYCGMDNSKKSLNRAQETIYDKVLAETSIKAKKQMVRINYTLPNNKRGEKVIDYNDLNTIEKCSEIVLHKFRTCELPKGDKVSDATKLGINYTHQFYTYRNFVYLSRVYELIKDDTTLLAWFTSVQQNSTLMYKFRTDRKGGILNGTLFFPSISYENNPYYQLKRRIDDIIAAHYSQRGNSVITLASATNLSTLGNNSVDYIFIDPPFGANIMYSELNTLWESWLGVLTNCKKEAIVNNAQCKSLFDYQTLMNESLREFYRVLKPGRWMTVEFSNTSASVWNSIQNALQGVGFVLSNIAALDKKQGSFNAVTSTTAVKQDLIITCYKPADQLTKCFETASDAGIYVWDFIEDLLHHLPVHVIKERKTSAVIERSPKILFDRLISYYVQHGYSIPMDAQEFQRGLRERFVERDGMFFTAEQALQYEEKKSKSDGMVPLGLFISNEAEGIQWLKNRLTNGAQTYQQISNDWMQDIVAGKKNDKMPELMDILKDNFIEDESGAWHLPNPEKEADLAVIRNRRLQKEFDFYVDQAKNSRVKIKEVRLEALRYGFKECYRAKDFQTIMAVAARIPENLVMEDEVLLQYYDIASSRV